MADYAKFLLRRFIISQFTKQGSEVHVIFDNPGRIQNTPKYFIHCRICKRTLVNFIGNSFLHNAGAYLSKNQTLYVAGAFDGDITDTAWFVHGQDSPQPDPRFTCVAEETDTRLWLHVRNTKCHRILIMSPDTDVYNIGLPLPCVREKEVVVQVSTYSAREMKFLHLSSLTAAFKNDPDLARIDHKILQQIIQTIYATTGCDYISFFSEIGKATFLRYFFQYAAFITAGSDPETPGTLADIQLEEDKYKLGYLAFIRP